MASIFVLLVAGLSLLSFFQPTSQGLFNVEVVKIGLEASLPEPCDLSIKATTTTRGANGTPTYYFPHDAGYFQIDADEFFCTAQDAQLAGYRPARVQ